jgi:YVTN family beta-propeller protein
MTARTRRLMWVLLAVLPVTAVAAAPSFGSRAAVAAPLSGVPRGADLALFGAPAVGTPGPDGPDSFDATLPNGRRVTPAGVSVQIGQNPLNSVLTPDGRFLITSNDDERGNPPRTGQSVWPPDTKSGADKALSQYSLTITDTATMTIVAAIAVPGRRAAGNPGVSADGQEDSDKGKGLFLGLATLQTPAGYTLYAAGGPSDVVFKYELGLDGVPTGIMSQITVPVPTDKTQANYGMAAPGWLTLSADGQTLYVVNNNGNSVIPIDVSTNARGTPIPVGYFPYAAQQFGNKLFVSNWGVTTRTFADGQGSTNPLTGVVTHHGTPFIGGGTANLFANPETDPQRSSSLSVIDLGAGPAGSISLARPIDGVNVVGGTHPSALAVATNGGQSALYVADANEDRIAIVDPVTETLVRRLPLRAPVELDPLEAPDGSIGPDADDNDVYGLTPDALATSPDQQRLYVAEAGLNSVAVYDVSEPLDPRFLGRIPAGWYPTGVTVSPDGGSLYITNAKGAGSPYGYQGTYGGKPDVKWMFGSVQKVNLGSLDLAASTRQVIANTVERRSPDTGKISMLQGVIKHVVYILRENKTYDTYFGDDTVLNGRGASGDPLYAEYGADVPNTKALAEQFTIADNSYADAEESNAGHSFALAGTSTDYQQKTMMTRERRPLINTKNQDPEDYPLRGYLFNAMARNGLSFRDYGDGIRISGYDDALSGNFCADDPKMACDNSTYDNITDTKSPTAGLGGLYSETLPAMKVLAGHIDESYPGWNLRISDQRRAAEFIRDYGRLIAAHEAPQFTFVWLPGDHTGSCGSNGISCNPVQEVADNDLALGQMVDFISHSRIWRDTAIFVTEDDAQASPDHVSAHRTYISVISPWARRGAVVHTLSSTVSVPKTIEELLGLPAMGYGDLFANDLIDHFATTPDFKPFKVNTSLSGTGNNPALTAPPETQRIWDLTARLDNATYDADNVRLGQLTDLYFASLKLAKHKGQYSSRQYWARQNAIFAHAREIVR